MLSLKPVTMVSRLLNKIIDPYGLTNGGTAYTSGNLGYINRFGEQVDAYILQSGDKLYFAKKHDGQTYQYTGSTDNGTDFVYNMLHESNSNSHAIYPKIASDVNGENFYEFYYEPYTNFVAHTISLQTQYTDLNVIELQVIDKDGIVLKNITGVNKSTESQLHTITFDNTTIGPNKCLKFKFKYHANSLSAERFQVLGLHSSSVITTSTGGTPSSTDISPNPTFYFGRNLEGALDDTRIYDRLLSLLDIQSLQSIGGKLVHFKFEEAEGDTVYDYSGHQYDATAKGTLTTDQYDVDHIIGDRSFKFTGSNYIEVDGSNLKSLDSNKMTISTWIKTSELKNLPIMKKYGAFKLFLNNEGKICLDHHKLLDGNVLIYFPFDSTVAPDAADFINVNDLTIGNALTLTNNGIQTNGNRLDSDKGIYFKTIDELRHFEMSADFKISETWNHSGSVDSPIFFTNTDGGHYAQVNFVYISESTMQLKLVYQGSTLGNYLYPYVHSNKYFNIRYELKFNNFDRISYLKIYINNELLPDHLVFGDGVDIINSAWGSVTGVNEYNVFSQNGSQNRRAPHSGITIKNFRLIDKST